MCGSLWPPQIWSDTSDSSMVAITSATSKIFQHHSQKYLHSIQYYFDMMVNLCLVSGDLAAAAVLVYSLLVIKPPTRRPCPKLHLISPLPLSATISVFSSSCAMCIFHMLLSNQLKTNNYSNTFLLCCIF